MSNSLIFLTWMGIIPFICLTTVVKLRGGRMVGDFLRQHKTYIIAYLLLIIVVAINIFIGSTDGHQEKNFSEFYNDSINPSKFKYFEGGGVSRISLENKKYGGLNIRRRIYSLSEGWSKTGPIWDSLTHYSNTGFLIEKNAHSDTLYLKKQDKTIFLIIDRPN